MQEIILFKYQIIYFQLVLKYIISLESYISQKKKTKENFEPLEEDESIYFNENEIILINEIGNINIFLINKEKCGIVCGYKNYYICNLINMEINLKIELNIKEKLFLLQFIDDNNKYKAYLTDESNKKLLYISS